MVIEAGVGTVRSLPGSAPTRGLMMESAASRAAKIAREELGHTARQGMSNFSRELGVTVWGGKVYKGTGLARDELGDLAGACAGVIPASPPPRPLQGLIAGVGPKLYTTFVRCANGNEKRRRDVRANIGVPTLQQVQWAAAEFNRLADAVGQATSDWQAPGSARPWAGMVSPEDEEVMEHWWSTRTPEQREKSMHAYGRLRPQVARAVWRKVAQKQRQRQDGQSD